MTPRLLRMIFGIGTAILVMQSTALACSCAELLTPISRRYEITFVFIGKVVSIDRPAVTSTTVSRSAPVTSPDGTITAAMSVTSSIDLSKTTRISIEKQFRGSPITELRVAGDGSSCDYNFVEGQSYLIYAPSSDGARIDRCNRPVPLSYAAEDLKFIEGAIAKQPQSILYGFAFHRIATVDGKPELRIPDGNIEVVVEGVNGPIRRPATRTPEYGYEFVIPPGEYRVWLERDGRPINSPQAIKLQNGETRNQSLFFD